MDFDFTKQELCTVNIFEQNEVIYANAYRNHGEEQSLFNQLKQ